MEKTTDFFYKSIPIEEHIANVGSRQTAPPLPEDGLKKQWLPYPIRWIFRVTFLPFILLDLTMQKIARGVIRTPFKQRGHCKKRGNCCYYILMKKNKGLLKHLLIFWNTQVNGFFLRGHTIIDQRGNEKFVMGCRYLEANGKCSIYHFRPMVCRTWPRIEYFGYPKILKGCGYYAEPRHRSKCSTENDSPLKIIQ